LTIGQRKRLMLSNGAATFVLMTLVLTAHVTIIKEKSSCPD
jgi:hypothetical protein